MGWPLSSLWGKSLKEEVSDAFTRDTGILIHHVENIGLDPPAPFFDALEKKKRPPFDILHMNSIPALRIAMAGNCEQFDEKEFPVLKNLGKRAKPAARGVSGWPFVNLYVVRYAMMCRDSAFPEGAPESWSIFLDPRFKGRVSIYPGGKGFYPIAQVMGGGKLDQIPDDMRACWEFIKSLKTQIGQMGYNTQVTEFIRRGEIDLFFTALTNIIQWKKDGLGVSWTVPREGTADCEDGLLVPRFLPENITFWAKQYVAFALKQEIQKNFCYRLGASPVHYGIAPQLEFENDPAYPKDPDDLENVLYVPDAITVDYEAVWMKKFNEIGS